MILTFKEAARYALMLETNGWYIMRIAALSAPDIHSVSPGWYVVAQHWPSRSNIDTQRNEFTGTAPRPDNELVNLMEHVAEAIELEASSLYQPTDQEVFFLKNEMREWAVRIREAHGIAPVKTRR